MKKIFTLLAFVMLASLNVFAQDDPVEITSMTIVGDFLGYDAEEDNFNPNNGWAMVQDAENPAIWTYTKNNFTVTANTTYRYKAIANGDYGVYELPAGLNNNEYYFEKAGVYNLTFMADCENHVLTLEVERVLKNFSVKFATDYAWETVKAYAWSGSGDSEIRYLGDWPGTEMTKNGDIFELSFSNYDTPEKIIFNNDAGEQTADLEFVNGKTYRYLAPATNIDITVDTGSDIAAALEAAKEEVGKVGDITIRLQSSGEYTLSNTLTVPNRFFLYGEGATITVDAEMNQPIITLDGTEIFAEKADGTESDHKYIEKVEVRGVTILGLQNSLVKDNQKTMVQDLTIDYSVIEMPANNKNVLDFNSKGYVGAVYVTNSTIYAKEANTGFFAQYGSRPKNINSDWLQVFDFENSTIVNIANGKNFNDLKQNGTAQNVYTILNCIFVDCGKQAQVIVGFNKGQTSNGPVWNVAGNYFAWGGECVTDAEVAKAGKDKEGEDIAQGSISGELTFADLANGDLSVSLKLAPNSPKPESLGDARWGDINFIDAFNVVGAYGNKDADEDDVIFTKAWNTTLNELEAQEDGTYTLTFNGIELEEAGTIYYKVVKNYSWDTNWGFNGGDADYYVSAPGVYDITFIFNPTNVLDNNFNLTCVVKAGTPTAINEVAAEQPQGYVIYNLNGQRVTNAQKGLFIVNGRKVMMK